MKFLLLLFLLPLLSCKHLFKKQDTPPLSNEVLDTLRTAGIRVEAQPEIFETAYIPGTVEKIEDTPLPCYGVTIGKLKLPTGKIVACDPLHIDEYGIPFTYEFPKGEFPVQLAIVKGKEVQVTAYARIYFSDEPVVKWEKALQSGQNPLTGGNRGYGVDGGVGLFMDSAAIKELDPKTVENFDGAMFKDMDKHYHNTWRYSMYQTGSYNLAAFTTGFGDGRYVTYIGFDSAGKACRLLTDFGLFNWWKK